MNKQNLIARSIPVPFPDKCKKPLEIKSKTKTNKQNPPKQTNKHKNKNNPHFPTKPQTVIKRLSDNMNSLLGNKKTSGKISL